MERWDRVVASLLSITSIALIAGSSLAGCGPAFHDAPEPGAPLDVGALAPPAPPPPALAGGPVVPAPPTWIDGAPSRSIVIAGADATLHLGIWIEAPSAPAPGPRASLSLALVVDGSGSMAGEKIEHARLAAASLLEGLAPGDQVSVCSFADGVTAVARPTPVGPDTLGGLFARVRQIQAMGGTNLHDGLLVGASWAASSPQHPVRRVVVVSDGQANVGPSTPEALGDVAARFTEAAVQVSAIGVGLDYDEQTLGALALRSSGRLYHLQEPSQMAAILEQEVRLLGETVALGATLEIAPAEGVELLGAELAGARRDGAGLRVDLGTLYAGQRREILVRARVRGEAGGAGEGEALAGGARDLASARLVYQPRADRAERLAQVIPLRASVGRDPEAAARSAHPRVRAMLARHEAAVAQQRAAEMLNAGRGADAAAVLEGAERHLEATAGALPAGEERERLAAQAARIGDTKKRALSATTQRAARETALDSYGYSFEDEGLSAPSKAPSKGGRSGKGK